MRRETGLSREGTRGLEMNRARRYQAGNDCKYVKRSHRGSQEV